MSPHKHSRVPEIIFSYNLLMLPSRPIITPCDCSGAMHHKYNFYYNTNCDT